MTTIIQAYTSVVKEYQFLELFSVQSLDLKVKFTSGDCQAACILTLHVCLKKYSTKINACVANPTKDSVVFLRTQNLNE